MATERVLSNLNLISFKTEGGLQNHIDELQDGDLVFTPDNSLKGTLLDFKWADHLLNDMSWLRADTFSWQSGDVYVAAYNHLVDDAFSVTINGEKYYAWHAGILSGIIYYTKSFTPNQGDIVYEESGTGEMIATEYTVTSVAGNELTLSDGSIVSADVMFVFTDTIGDTTIKYYRAADGHKICQPDQEDKLLELYNKTGVAWYYILDTINKQFKLPRRHSQQIVRSVKNADGSWYRLYADGWVEQGGALPITTSGYITYPIAMNQPYVPVFKLCTNRSSASHDCELYPTEVTETQFYAYNTAPAGGNKAEWQVIGQSAIDTSSLQDSEKHLYFYVGNFERDALEQTAGVTTEMLNNKADVDLSNMNASQAAKNTIVGWSVPDYSAGVDISKNTDFICPMNGVIAGEVSAASNGYCQIKVNGIVIMQVGSENNQRCRGPFYAQIQKDDVVHILTSGNAEIPQSNFYPLKGVN